MSLFWNQDYCRNHVKCLYRQNYYSVICIILRKEELSCQFILMIFRSSCFRTDYLILWFLSTGEGKTQWHVRPGGDFKDEEEVSKHQGQNLLVNAASRVWEVCNNTSLRGSFINDITQFSILFDTRIWHQLTKKRQFDCDNPFKFGETFFFPIGNSSCLPISCFIILRFSLNVQFHPRMFICMRMYQTF